VGLGLGWVQPVTGIEDVDLFRVEVPVPDRGDATRVKALQGALTRVLIRLTGDPQVASRRAAREILSNPQTYLQQFRYVERTGPGVPYALEARFDPRSLQAAVSAAGLPVWSSHRPSVVVWLAVDGRNGRSLVGEDDRSGIRATVYSAAEARGLPVVLPLLDLEDRRQVSASDILAGFDDVARRASTRYATDAVLTGRAKAYGDGSWRVAWHLYSGSQSREWVTEGRTLNEAVAAGIQRLADEMARGLAARTTVSGGDTIQLRVEGVGDLAGLARVQRYLEGLGRVEWLFPARIEGDAVTFSVKAKGGLGGLEQAIDLGDVLERSASSGVSAGTSPGQTLTYRVRL